MGMEMALDVGHHGRVRGKTNTSFTSEDNRSISDLIESREMDSAITLTARLLKNMGFDGRYVPKSERPDYVSDYEAVYELPSGSLLSICQCNGRRSSACGKKEYVLSFELTTPYRDTVHLKMACELLGWTAEMHVEKKAVLNRVTGILYNEPSEPLFFNDIQLLPAFTNLIKITEWCEKK